MEERGDEEVRVEGKEGGEEKGLRKGVGELGENVGDMESGSAWVGDEVREAKEADGAALLGANG